MRAGVEVGGLVLRHRIRAEDAGIHAQARQVVGFQRLAHGFRGGLLLRGRFDHARVGVDPGAGDALDPRCAVFVPPGRPTPHGRQSPLGVAGESLDQPTYRRVGRHGPEDLVLAAQHRRVRQHLARLVRRRRPPPGRQRLRETVPQARDSDGLGQQHSPGQRHRRHLAGLHTHTRVQPGTLHYEGAPLLVMHGRGRVGAGAAPRASSRHRHSQQGRHGGLSPVA